jgi:hypothetical protein
MPIVAVENFDEAIEIINARYVPSHEFPIRARVQREEQRTSARSLRIHE